MRMGTTIPALPVRSVEASTEFYVERLGFEVLHTDGHLGVLQRDDAQLHLWQAGDTSWSGRADLAARPVVSGAESFLAGTASCRIQLDGVEGVEGVDALYDEMAAADVLHGVSGRGPLDTDYGTREFHVLDLDGNLLTFFVWR
ncbi:Catechol 2,3-dioxygenase [Nocardioides lianchengensis]|uniref:Bleomycin resistance protein n=1 Tax=Nocardioides lianchengensis TaxID=1045774 RepID=A0A1G6N7F5_9ACTN|nr:Catechol 2,3-dioxygenase [Nocardioides lianchengensis]